MLPCGLATQAEIKAALGMDIGKPAINTKINPSGGALCDFQVGEMGAGGIVVRAMAVGGTPQKMVAELQKRKMRTWHLADRRTRLMPEASMC